MTNQYKDIQRLQSHYSIPDIVLCLHDKLSSWYGVNYNCTELEQNHSQVLNIMQEQLAERIWEAKSQSSLLNIYFQVSGFHSLFLLIHFHYGLNTC